MLYVGAHIKYLNFVGLPRTPWNLGPVTNPRLFHEDEDRVWHNDLGVALDGNNRHRAEVEKNIRKERDKPPSPLKCVRCSSHYKIVPHSSYEAYS